MATASTVTGSGRPTLATGRGETDSRMPWHQPGFDPLAGPSWSDTVNAVESRQGGWDGSGRGGQSGDSFDQQQAQRWSFYERNKPFSSFIALATGAFPATPNWDSLRVTHPMLAELLSGIETYEFNMKVIAGGAFTQGSVVNRYS